MAPCTLTHGHAAGAVASDPYTAAEQIKRVMELEIALAELRGAGQADGAGALGTPGAEAARIQREIDVVQLPAFQRYVEALGAKLEIQPHFGDLEITELKLSG